MTNERDVELMSRREVLGSTAKWFFASTLLGQGALLAGCGGSSSVLPDADWSGLARRITGSLLLPSSSGYRAAALPNNLRFASQLPGGVAQCKTANDVAACLAWSQEEQMPLIVRSGGHNYAGYSTTKGLMIDVSQMKDFEMQAGLMKVGAGVQNAEAYNKLEPTSLAVTHGRCLGVGLSGLVLGGGVGFNMRLHGVTSDQLKSTDIVLADGRKLTLSESENADLFWAVRGGAGGNFGVHTSFTFEPFAVDQLTMFNITWNSRLPEVFAALFEAIRDVPDEFGLKVGLGYAQAGAPLMLNLLGQLKGSPEQLASILQPLTSIAAPKVSEIEVLPYWPAQRKLSELGGPGYYHERARISNALLTSEAQGIVFAMLQEWPGTSKGVSFKFFFGGGAANRVPRTATAYVHRDMILLTSIGLNWSDQDAASRLAANFNWLDRFYDEIAPKLGSEAYQNFPDPALANWAEAYYAENLPELRRIKTLYDPKNVFNFEQSIPLA